MGKRQHGRKNSQERRQHGEETIWGGDYMARGDYTSRKLEKRYKNIRDIYKEEIYTGKRHISRKNNWLFQKKIIPTEDYMEREYKDKERVT